MTFLSKLAGRIHSVIKSASVAPRDVPMKHPVQKKAIPTAVKLPVAPTIKAANEALNEAVTPPLDLAAFFAALRQGPLRHRKPEQVTGTEAILLAMQGLPMAWTAYALATAWHETAATMQPIKEYGGRSYFMGRYDITGNKPHIARALGNTQMGDGALFAGRGYVQLTGRANYTKAGKKLGIDLVGNPDLAMQPEHAARIMCDGMTGGWFTGKGFSDYLPAKGPASLAQFTNARRIINGTDKAGKIAGEAVAFQAALIAGGWA